MLIPLPIILFVVLLIFSIKNAKQKVNVNKNVLIRLLVLALSIGLIYLFCYISSGRKGMLGALYLSAYFTGAWILYLLVETISFFVIKRNQLANSNLIMLAFIAFIVAMVIVQFS
jgi:phosphatidylglycerophosphate synthase